MEILPGDSIGGSYPRLTNLANNLITVFSANSGKPGAAGEAAEVGQMAFSVGRGAVYAIYAAGQVDRFAPLVTGATDVVERVMPVLSRVGVPVIVAAGVVKTADHLIQGDNRDAAKVAGFTAGTVVGIFEGASAGAVLCSVVPVFGTGICAAIGGVVGGFGGGAGAKALAGVIYDAIVPNPSLPALSNP